MNAKTKELLELLQDEKIMKAFGEAKTLEAAVAVLKDAGLNITVAELEAAQVEMSNVTANGELSENDLEAVSGGKINWWGVLEGAIKIIKSLCGK